MSRRYDVVVVGGGVAGISAAMHCARMGLDVLLLEQRRLLGGRAGSFAHEIGAGGLLDNAQHVLLGCCSELRRLYQMLHVEDLVRFESTLRFADIRGRRAEMKAASWLPAPLHLGPSLAGFGLLHAGQKWEITQAMGRMLVDGDAGRSTVENLSFETYLRSLGQSARTIRDYWDVICVSALNEPCRDAGAKYGMQVFQEAFLYSREGYQLGYAGAPLSQMYERMAGVEVRRGCGARELVCEGGRVVGIGLVGGEKINAEQTILAVSPAAAIALLRDVADLDPRLSDIGKLSFRPILGAHLLYDRPVPIVSPVALIGTHLQWIFVDSQRPELIHGVVSAADLLPQGNLAEMFDSELKQVFGEFGEARLVASRLVTETRATFRPLPGVDRIRPPQGTRIPGLTLAGDYTQTNWPATMEGAVRSGLYAAERAAVCF